MPVPAGVLFVRPAFDLIACTAGERLTVRLVELAQSVDLRAVTRSWMA